MNIDSIDVYATSVDLCYTCIELVYSDTKKKSAEIVVANKKKRMREVVQPSPSQPAKEIHFEKPNGRKINGRITPNQDKEKGQNNDVEWSLSSERKYKLPVRYLPVLKMDYDKLKEADADKCQLKSHIVEQDTKIESLHKQIEEMDRANEDSVNIYKNIAKNAEQELKFLQDEVEKDKTSTKIG